MYDIVTVGSSTIDIFLTTEAKSKKSLVCYPIGGKILVEDLKFMTGGGGTNSAVAFSRMGFKTAYLGKLGNDESSDYILKELKKEKIDFIGARGKGMTGHSIILDSHKIQDRTILAYKGINDDLSYDEVNKPKTKWLYFSSMLGKSFKMQKKLAKYADKNSINISYNISQYLADKGLNYIKPILKYSKIFILNKEEILALTKEKDVVKAIRKVQNVNNGIVCVTDGVNKIRLYNGKTMYEIKPHAIKAKEKTGAGDAFASGLTSALIKEKRIEEAMNIGTLNAESVIKYIGAKNKLLTWNESVKLYNKHKIKVTKNDYS